MHEAAEPNATRITHPTGLSTASMSPWPHRARRDAAIRLALRTMQQPRRQTSSPPHSWSSCARWL